MCAAKPQNPTQSKRRPSVPVPQPVPWRCCLLVHCLRHSAGTVMFPFLSLGAVPYLVLSHCGEGPPSSFQTQLDFFYIQLGFPIIKGPWGRLPFYSGLLASFAAWGFPKKCTSSFLRLGTPYGLKSSGSLQTPQYHSLHIGGTQHMLKD